jgi:segregation and condensation protein B
LAPSWGFRWHDPRRLPENHRLSELYKLLDHAKPTGEGELARTPDVALVEAALFAADEPLTLRRLGAATGIKNTEDLRFAVSRLEALYEKGRSAFRIEELAGGYQLFTRPDLHSWLVRLGPGSPDVRLSPAARETLAIVAYRQPIMRAEIESIRGVQCSDILRLLMEKGLVRISGRHPSLGRPVLYGTTRKFLQLFGLKGLEDLPAFEKRV